MNASWDHDKGGRDQWIAWLAGIMREAKRCMKPGSYALVWALPRTSHWTATALEDAGLVLQDIITHHFATGFPKGKAQLKPATEHWLLAYKPGKRVLNIDDCRIGLPAKKWESPRGGICLPDPTARAALVDNTHGRWPANVTFQHSPLCEARGVKRVAVTRWGKDTPRQHTQTTNGYDGGWGDGQSVGYEGSDGTEQVEDWICHESCPVGELDRQAGDRSSGGFPAQRYADKTRSVYGAFKGGECPDGIGPNKGNASRFFFCSKSSQSERSKGLAERNPHISVKPLELVEYLCRLVTPKNGVVLDPFCGSGTTLLAAMNEGFSAIGVEQDAAMLEIARQRLGLLASLETTP